MTEPTSTHLEPGSVGILEIDVGRSGWLARLPSRGLAARGRTEQEARDRVLATAALVEALASRWAEARSE